MHVIGTAGHVDHGKSSLVRRLTGIDPDRFAEEKRRGLTIDLGFAWLSLPSGAEIGIVDVPGHERFIKNMLAGAGGISIVLFVIDATEGWMPQSAEHLAALEVLGVSSGVVALTKRDLVDAEMLELAAAEIEERLAPSVLAGAPVVPVSAATGEGIDDLVGALDRAATDAAPAPDRGRPRLWVDRSFIIQGSGTVVTGTLAGGSFHAGDEVEIVPGRRRARIRSIQSHKKEVEVIGPGNRVALNLAGLERAEVARGDAVGAPGAWRATERIDARIRVLGPDISGTDYTLGDTGAHLLFAGSAETPVRIKLLGAPELAAGTSGFAQVYLRDPLPLGRGDRFVLRDAGRAVIFGGGEVLDPLPSIVRASDPRRRALLERLGNDDALAALVEDAGTIDRDEALLRAGAGDSAALPSLGHLLVSPARLDELVAVVVRSLEAHHRDRPLERGAPREQVRAATGLEPDAFDALVATMDEVMADGARLHLAQHSVDLSPPQQRARDELVKTIEQAGFNPPLAKDLGADPALVRALVERGDLVNIGDFYLTGTQARRAREIVRSAIEKEGPITVAQIRDLLGTT
ncbi:MAG TPA: selenocysteine-specific translation elongation factor, partial [Actinomycetota bacterium]|nr:selenocysteine-specific translation elongation factor [Actinomycetota bacterium]